MGLAVVKKIIEEHDGSIEVDSVPGEGTTFVVKVPAGRAEIDSSSTAEPAPKRKGFLK